MSEDPKPGSEAAPDDAIDPGAVAAAAVSTADAADNQGEAGEVTLASLQAEVETLRSQVDEAADRALRAQAEAENSRRRAAQETDKARKFALEKFAGDLLPVVDSLEKAVEVLGTTDATDSPDNAGLTAVADGVRLSLKLFLDTLGKAGVVQLDPLGEPFNPQFHEAMAMVENPAMEPNSVMDVVQKGYTLNERLLRAAMVVVTRAPAGGVDTNA